MIASVGRASAQTPQSMQRSASITPDIAFAEVAPVGHSERCSASYAVIRDFVSRKLMIGIVVNYMPLVLVNKEVEKETFGASNMRLEGDEKTSRRR